MTEQTPDRPKRKKTAKPLPDSAPVESPVEAIAESAPDIEPEIESESALDIQQEPPQVLPKPKGKYNTEFYKAIGIPVCSFCGEKESLVCPESKPDCPVLLAKNAN